jgi:hypothetical protein
LAYPVSTPCAFCGVRPDVTCRHRPGVGSAPVQAAPKVDKRTTRTLQGFAFHKDWLTAEAAQIAKDRLGRKC